ncbi:MAG: hypothetical protein LBD29_05690 [Treponema sp.]|jgi:hypothetical protein|nr:hypothetical protein [Treponema sp.]
MNTLNIIRLDLHAPLFYSKDERFEPFEYPSPLVTDEILFCFEIAADQYQRIEPEYDRYLGSLLFRGAATVQPSEKGFELPAGTYLFAQVQDILSQEDIIWTAAEIQKNGLSDRLTLENRLYFRRFFEHGQSVTQIFRPYA